MPAGRAAFRSAGGLSVLGVRVDALPLAGAVRQIMLWAAPEREETHSVHATGVHGIMESRRNPFFRRLLNAADLVLPDGMPLVWIARWTGIAGAERIFGPDLLEEVCAASRGTSVRHFFCGGMPGVAQDLARTLESRHPGLTVAGTFTPPMTPPGKEEFQAIAGRIKHSGASIIWIGVSTPKQESWVDALRPMLRRGVFVTVGAAFDYHTGRLRRAPLWMQEAGLEWLFRLRQEPQRLFLRYARNNPAFLWFILLQAAGIPVAARGRGARS